MTATRDHSKGLNMEAAIEQGAKWRDEYSALYRISPAVGSLQILVLDYGLPGKWTDVNMTPAYALTRLSPLPAPEPVQGEAVMHKRFNQIEREIMEGKHTAASVFTQMRTAAVYLAAAKPDAELVELLTEARADLKAYIDAEYPAPMLEYPHNQRKRESDMDVVNRIDAKLAELQGGNHASTPA